MVPSSWAIYRVSAANAVKFRVLRACVWCPLLVGPYMGQDEGVILAFEWWKLYWEELNINISKTAGFPCSVFFLREIYRKSGEQRELRTEEGRLDCDRHRCEEACSVFPRSLTRLYLPLYLPFFWAHLFFSGLLSERLSISLESKKKLCSGNFLSPNLENSNIHLAVHLPTHNPLQFGLCAHSTIKGNYSSPRNSNLSPKSCCLTQPRWALRTSSSWFHSSFLVRIPYVFDSVPPSSQLFLRSIPILLFFLSSLIRFLFLDILHLDSPLPPHCTVSIS